MRRFLIKVGLTVSAAFAVYLFILYWVVVGKFESHRWNLPSRVYSDSVYLYPGAELPPEALEEALARRGYKPVRLKLSGPGDYTHIGSTFTIGLHSFDYPWERFAGGTLEVVYSGRTIDHLTQLPENKETVSARLEPEVVATLFDEKMEDRSLITLDQIPPTLIDAIVCMEDERFWRHFGVDPLALVRALLTNILHGRVVQGGSTLTQQLVKNFFLSSERTYIRKFHELWMAFILEARYSKEEILTAYLNEIYLGQRASSSVAGVGEASRFFFSKDISQLDLPEVALVAGLIRAPGLYSPFRHPDRARERRDLVLSKMFEAKKITERQYQSAVKTPLRLTPRRAATSGAPFFVDFIEHEVQQTFPKEKLVRDGLKIFTTLDAKMQESAEAALSHGLERLEHNYPKVKERLAQGGRLEGVLISISPQNGYIRAFVGGRDFSTSQFNRATTALRQPGSAFKPFVYLAALEQDDGQSWTPASQIEDTAFDIESGGETWAPKNYDEQFHGWVTLQTALENSYNVATAKLGLQVKPEAVVTTARKLGIASPLEAVPSVALGALEVTPLELARAYAGIASGGFQIQPLGVLQVVTPGGEMLEKKSVGFKRAVSPVFSIGGLPAPRAFWDFVPSRRARPAPPATIAMPGLSATPRNW